MNNDKDTAEGSTAAPVVKPRAEPGADSQLHNYNVMLSRLGDLFGDDDEPESDKK